MPSRVGRSRPSHAGAPACKQAVGGGPVKRSNTKSLIIRPPVDPLFGPPVDSVWTPCGPTPSRPRAEPFLELGRPRLSRVKAPARGAR
eukprot:3395899-Pyramimonas_sp.AAC.1